MFFLVFLGQNDLDVCFLGGGVYNSCTADSELRLHNKLHKIILGNSFLVM